MVEDYEQRGIYISFSGGKDSTILHYMIDKAVPNNKIKRIYDNTGIEYPQMIKFVKNMSLKDSRIEILKPTKNIPRTLKMVGYPFKSKQHSHNLNTYRNNIELCDRYKNDKILENIAKRLKKGEERIFDEELINYLKSIPKGANTFVKYWYGIRLHKATPKENENNEEYPTQHTEDSGRERVYLPL